MIIGFYDGACEPFNPGGHCSWGAIVKSGEHTIWTKYGYVGYGSKMSSNVAEYCGVIALMEWLIFSGFKEVKIHGDNQMSILQLSGIWRAKKGLYVPYYYKALKLKNQFRLISFEWIPREYNSQADALSKLALQERNIHAKVRSRTPGASVLVGPVGDIARQQEKATLLPREERASYREQERIVGSDNRVNHSASTKLGKELSLSQQDT